MEFRYALKSCMRESFFGSLVSASATLITGQFAMIPITAKFVTNYAFCIKESYTVDLWSKARETLHDYEILNTNIDSFRDRLLSINYNNVITRSQSTIQSLLQSSLNPFEHYVENWATDKFTHLIQSFSQRKFAIRLLSDDYSFLRKIIGENQEELINEMLSKPLVERAIGYVPHLYNVIDKSLLKEQEEEPFIMNQPEQAERIAPITPKIQTPQQVLRQISTLPNGPLAAEFVQFLYRNRGITSTYSDFARGSGISYGYANDLLHRLDRFVVGIVRRPGLHIITVFVLPETEFFEASLRALR